MIGEQKNGYKTPQYNRETYLKCKSKIQGYQKKYYSLLENKEKRKEYHRKYAKENREEMNSKQREYCKRPEVKAKIKIRNRKAYLKRKQLNQED